MLLKRFAIILFLFIVKSKTCTFIGFTTIVILFYFFKDFLSIFYELQLYMFKWGRIIIMRKYIFLVFILLYIEGSSSSSSSVINMKNLLYKILSLH